MTNIIHVIVGIIFNAQNEVLVALRSPDSHQGGLWEFPGGKVEKNETSMQALIRELKEEVGIEVQSASPLTTLQHDYPDKKVLLDVWKVDKFSGEPHACETQTAVKWVPLFELSQLEMPAANRVLIDKIFGYSLTK